MFPSPESSTSGFAPRLSSADICSWVTASASSSVEKAFAETEFPPRSTVPVIGVQALPLAAEMTVGIE